MGQGTKGRKGKERGGEGEKKLMLYNIFQNGGIGQGTKGRKGKKRGREGKRNVCYTTLFSGSRVARPHGAND